MGEWQEEFRVGHINGTNKFLCPVKYITYLTFHLFSIPSGEVRIGRFEIVPKENLNDVWDRLRKQQVLTKFNILSNLSIASEAWTLGSKLKNASQESSKEEVLTTGIGEGYDEDDDTFVHKTDVKVSKLSDDALQSWVATFLLGLPSLGA